MVFADKSKPDWLSIAFDPGREVEAVSVRCTVSLTSTIIPLVNDFPLRVLRASRRKPMRIKAQFSFSPAIELETLTDSQRNLNPIDFLFWNADYTYMHICFDLTLSFDWSDKFKWSFKIADLCRVIFFYTTVGLQDNIYTGCVTFQLSDSENTPIEYIVRSLLILKSTFCVRFFWKSDEFKMCSDSTSSFLDVQVVKRITTNVNWPFFVLICLRPSTFSFQCITLYFHY